MDDRHYMWVSQGSQGSLDEMKQRLFSVRAGVRARTVGRGYQGLDFLKVLRFSFPVPVVSLSANDEVSLFGSLLLQKTLKIYHLRFALVKIELYLQASLLETREMRYQQIPNVATSLWLDSAKDFQMTVTVFYFMTIF